MPPDPEPISRLRLHPAEIRSAGGSRLDDARAEFRAAWQTKVERKRRQAEWAEDLSFVFRQLLAVIVGFGSAGAGFLGYLARCGLSHIMTLALAGALLGFILALAAALIARRYAQLRRGEAHRLEREAREWERA
jgi:hypothetical protein